MTGEDGTALHTPAQCATAITAVLRSIPQVSGFVLQDNCFHYKSAWDTGVAETSLKERLPRALGRANCPDVAVAIFTFKVNEQSVDVWLSPQYE